jgi:hypothetical protein
MACGYESYENFLALGYRHNRRYCENYLRKILFQSSMDFNWIIGN